MTAGTVIVGAGHSGVQVAASLRDEGYEGTIRLVDSGQELPYQRPPLSKAFMKGEASADSLVLRGAAFYTESRIDLISGISATAIDSVQRRVSLSDGGTLAFDHLVLATGARARPLPVQGADFPGVFTLRDLGDALRIREAVHAADNIVVVGGGFIGLEFAAVAASFGKYVTVVETMQRVMARAISPAVSETFAAKHRSLGVTFEFGQGVAGFSESSGKVSAVVLSDGRTLACDMAVVGIGVLAEDRLAAAAGLMLSNGIVVDSSLRTSHPAILAVGDNNAHPNPFFGGQVRLESVQNAVDQAKTAARVIAGKASTYHAVPWFWSDQGDAKLQIAGIAESLDRHVIRGDAESGAFSVFGYSGGHVRVVESINRPADHMIARRLIADGRSPLPAEVADPSFDLKAFAMAKAGA